MLKKFNFDKKDCMSGRYIPEYVCDGVVEFFKESKKIKGRTSKYNKKNNLWEADINSDDKISTDANVDFSENDPRLVIYRHYLQQCLELYVEEYPELKRQPSFNVSKGYNIQYYKPGEGYKTWHCERANLSTTDRLLVFMTYLNDVPDGGTEFIYQDIKVKAEKGLTLIWPADWTHTHRGQISYTQDKYIVTGWYCYFLDDKLKEQFLMKNFIDK